MENEELVKLELPAYIMLEVAKAANYIIDNDVAKDEVSRGLLGTFLAQLFAQTGLGLE